MQPLPADDGFAAGTGREAHAGAERVPELPTKTGESTARLARSGAAPQDSTSAQRAFPSPEIGRFQIERELGRGGFGIVYLAFDPLLKRQVAVKVPRIGTLATPELMRRFLLEAEVAASLEHPYIVPVYEANQTDTGFCIVSAFCPGLNLSDWLLEPGNRLSPAQAARLVRCLAEATHYCHERGILHRDLKPGNVMLIPGEHDGLPFTPRLTDFGLAKLMEASLAETRSSVVLGSPLYMAPEQALLRGAEIGPASDIYGLGAILYELLTGRPPFQGAGFIEVLDQIRSQEPTRPRKLNPELPAALETICLKCIRKEPSQRYASAADLAADLGRFLAGQAPQARRATLGEMIWAWSRQPERIREAGVVALVACFIAIGPIVAGLFVILSGGGGFEDQLGPILGLFKIALLFVVPQFLLGYFTLQGSRIAIWAGVIAIPLLFVIVSGIIFGFIDSGGYLQGGVSDRTFVLSLEAVGMVLLLVELITYLAALQASSVRVASKG